MDGFNHLREQGTNTLSYEILEEVYGIFIIQIQTELFLNLNTDDQIVNLYIIWYSYWNTNHEMNHKHTFRMPFSGSEAMSGMLEPAIRWKRFNIRLLDFRKMLYASQQ